MGTCQCRIRNRARIVTDAVDGSTLQVYRCRAGRDRFVESAKIKTAARVAVAMFLLYPIIQFVLVYL